MAEYDAGLPNHKRLFQENTDHPVEVTGREEAARSGRLHRGVTVHVQAAAGEGLMSADAAERDIDDHHLQTGRAVFRVIRDNATNRADGVTRALAAIKPL